jgi:hypothetical protein
MTGMVGLALRMVCAISGAFEGDILGFTCLVGRRRRTRIEALILRVRVLGVPLLAALVDGLEECIVETFDDDHELLLFLCHGLACAERNRRRGGKQQQFPHYFLP